MLCGGDGVTNAEMWQRTYTKDRHRVSGSQSQVAMGRPCCKDRAAKMDTRCINLGRKGRQNENWEDLMADALQREAGGHASQTAKTRSEWSR